MINKHIISKCLIERSFGHFVRVLIDIDLSAKIRHQLWVEREGYAFLVKVDYENLPLFVRIVITLVIVFHLANL